MLLFSNFFEKGQRLRQLHSKWLTGEHSISFTRYAKAGETKIRESNNVFKSIVGLDTGQLLHFISTLFFCLCQEEIQFLFEDIEKRLKRQALDTDR